MSSKPNKHPSMSFDQHVQIAVHNAIKGDIDAKVTEATMIVAQEARKALSSMKMRLDALENLLLAKKEVTSTSLQEALWNVQETLFGIAPTDAPAELGCGVRLRVKEEKIGEETDAEPATESYVVLGQGEITPDVQNALLGAKAGKWVPATWLSAVAGIGDWSRCVRRLRAEGYDVRVRRTGSSGGGVMTYYSLCGVEK